MRLLDRLTHFIKGFARDQEGSALIEMAVFASVMVVLIPTMSIYADRINAQQKLNMGIRSGLQYMMANQSVSNDTLSDIVENSGMGSSTPITASASVACECSNGLSATCGTTCTGGAAPSKYLTVSASTTMTNFWGQASQVVTQQSTVRVQ